MSRKEIIYTVSDKNRDEGKQFLITEMSAYKAESWAIRLFLAIGNTGLDISPELAQQGMAGLLALGYSSLLKLPYESAESLLADMMGCIQAMPSSNVRRPLIDEDIEEVTTRLQLKKAIWNLHTDFFMSADQSISASTTGDPLGDSLTIKPRRKQ